MEKEVFNSVESKNFVEFEKAIKSELDTRITNSNQMQQIKSDYDKLQNIKDTFAKITSNGE